MQRIAATFIAAMSVVVMVGCGSPKVIDKGVVLKGYGEIKSVPDIGEFTVRVVTREVPSAGQRASEANRRKVDAVRQALTNRGVKSSDVATDTYEAGVVRPYVWDSRRQPKPFYRVSNSFNVTIRDVKKIGSTLDACIRAGATSVDSVSYRFSKLAKLQAEAMAAAVTDAKTRAEQVARAGGVRLLPISSVVDADLAEDGGVQNQYLVKAKRAAPTEAFTTLALPAPGTYAAPREESITADVVVTFAIQRR